VNRDKYIEPVAGIDPIDYFKEAKVLGRIFERRGYQDIPDYFGPRLKSISQRAYELEGLQVSYSGTGIGPLRDPDDNLVSIYSDFENRVGTFRGIGFAMFNEMECFDLGESGVSIEDFDTIAHVYDTEDVESVKKYLSRIKDTPGGFRLVADFILEHHEGEIPVRGHSVRAPGLILMDTIDLATINIFNVDNPPEEPGAEIWHVQPVLEHFHNNYRRLIRDPSFRKLKNERQKEILDQRLDELNKTLGLHRFKVNVKPSFIYVPEVDKEGKIRFVQIAAPEFKGGAVRADCVELQHIVNSGDRISSRKGNVDSNNSVCVVIEIDEDIQQKIGTNSSIVWAPVFGEGIGLILERNIRKREKGSSSVYDDDELKVQFYERAILDS
jgi:hypothetical protein